MSVVAIVVILGLIVQTSVLWRILPNRCVQSELAGDSGLLAFFILSLLFLLLKTDTLRLWKREEKGLLSLHFGTGILHTLSNEKNKTEKAVQNILFREKVYVNNPTTRTKNDPV